MTAYVVTYDLRKPGQNYNDLIEHLESFPTHWHIMQSVWIIGCTMTAKQLADSITPYLDDNDRLLVNEFVNNSAWWGDITDEQTSWLRRRLRVAAI